MIKHDQTVNRPSNYLLVGGLNPSEKYESIGIIIPNIWENKIDVPNHQPVIYDWYGLWMMPVRMSVWVCVG